MRRNRNEKRISIFGIKEQERLERLVLKSKGITTSANGTDASDTIVVDSAIGVVGAIGVDSTETITDVIMDTKDTIKMNKEQKLSLFLNRNQLKKKLKAKKKSINK
jgi:hypothetical protein